MKTKLTLLKNALLVGCAMFALTSCSSDDSNGLDYTTKDCEGTFIGDLNIRQPGLPSAPLDGTVRTFSETKVTVEALSATELKYTTSAVATSADIYGYDIVATVAYAGEVTEKYYTGTASLVLTTKAGVVTSYLDCTALCHAKPKGTRLEMDNKNGARVTYESHRKDIPVVTPPAAN